MPALGVGVKLPPASPEGQNSTLDTARLDGARFGYALGRLGPFEKHPTLAVAVSGGPDSMALTLLAHEWAKERGGSLLGLTVDHGMRPEASAEAQQVGAWLSDHGIAHQILTNTQPVPESGIHANLRAIRLHLLTEACQENGILHLLLAHHGDDQVETVALRRESASGPDGLAGMSAVRSLHSIRLLRPLLGCTKSDLVAFLNARAHPFFTDPSNTDPRFARARLRALAPSAQADLDRSEILATGLVRQEREAAVAAWLVENALINPLGYIVIASTGWTRMIEAGREIAGDCDHNRTMLSGIAHCLWSLGGIPYPPSTDQVAQALTNGRLAAGRATNLAGCLMSPHRHAVVISREPHSFTAASWTELSLMEGDGTRWGRLYAVESTEPWPDSVTLAPLSASRPNLKGFSGSGLATIPYEAVPGSARSAIPALWANGRVIAVPLLNGVCEDAPAELISTAAHVRIRLSPLRPVAPGSFEVACTEASAHYLPV